MRLERIITFGTIFTGAGFILLGPSQARLLVAAAICVWTVPQIVLLLRRQVRFSVWRFLACWVAIPLVVSSLFFYTDAMIRFGGPLAQLRMYGSGAWLTSVAIACGIGLAVAIALATIARGATELLLLGMSRWRPRKHLIWPILYLLNVTIALAYRYSR